MVLALLTTVVNMQQRPPIPCDMFRVSLLKKLFPEIISIF